MSIVAGVDFGTLSVRVSLFSKTEGRLGIGVAEYPLRRSAQDPNLATQSHRAQMNALVDAQINGSNPGPAIFVALRNWRSSSVSHGLQIAGTTTRLDFFELAFGEWLAWLAYLQEYRDTLAAADSSFFDTAGALDRNTATENRAISPASFTTEVLASP